MAKKVEKNKKPVITQEESNDYVQYSAEEKAAAKLKKILGESLKERLAAGATPPDGAQVMLKYSAPDFPTLGWRDIAYHMAIQIVRLKKQMPKKIAEGIEIHAVAEDPTEIEKAQAETVLTLIEAEIPKAPRPTLTTENNPDWVNPEEN